MNHSVLGFNGERLDPVHHTAHLGNGHRAYSPALMRFHCPDDLSPFGAGGVNPYAYCAGDPINHADPTGHHSFWGWLGIGVGVSLGVLLTPVSAGSSLAATLSIVSIASAVAATGLAIAQQFVEASNPKLGAALGWAALGAGILSGLSSAALARLTPEAKSLASLLKGVSNRPFGGLMMSGDAAGDSAGTAAGRTVAEHGKLVSQKSNVAIYDLGEKFKKVFSSPDWRIENEYRIHKLYHGEESAKMPSPTTIITKRVAGTPVQNGQWKFTPIDRENLLGAVKKAHALKIYHGDLHLNNILFDEGRREFNLIDFGHSIHPANDGLLNMEFEDFQAFMENKWARFESSPPLERIS
ncbi:RHS repeat-associated core domain-containing protein [Chromobacterium sp. ATCC 53434]|uniref:RHS repeat-associated core domain-containing protein n=1 Tax=Chromobacterium sp. (strain ATCC 53434 / SC 14030) TaxID=2059672 RepID=UPI0018F24760|nr:RHS repeat-associated core domain-containing protein [Chromobacterium sp. ATCC 53434]